MDISAGLVNLKNIYLELFLVLKTIFLKLFQNLSEIILYGGVITVTLLVQL